VLATRNPTALEAAVPGADVRAADFTDPSTLTHAFAGVERAVIISTDDIAHRAQGQIAAIEAASTAGVKHILYTSMLAPGPVNPAIIAPSHWATEEHLRSSGMAYTILRAGFYADFQVFEAQAALASGTLAHNRGEGRCAYISRDDIARAIAAVLVEGGHENATLDLTGTEAIDVPALARLYSEIGGRVVVPRSLDDEAMLELLGASSEGHSQYGALLTVSIGQAIRGGFLDIVTDTVAQLTGRAPEPLVSVLARHAGSLS
jgi:NAD(P)H dehydrogenase (quinone)